MKKVLSIDWTTKPPLPGPLLLAKEEREKVSEVCGSMLPQDSFSPSSPFEGGEGRGEEGLTRSAMERLGRLGSSRNQVGVAGVWRAVGSALALAAFCGLGCKTAQVTSEKQLAVPASARPTAVYVTDFDIGVEGIKHEDGLLAAGDGVVGRVGGLLSGNASDPAVRARQLVDLMANSLVKELTKSGFSAVRLQPAVLVPAQGWLLRGVFAEVQEGNRLRRAMIGFGQGQTDLQVFATIHDLSQGAPKPLYEVATDATSGSTPGAAPTLVLGPYGAAARFVMSGKDLDKNVKQTAAKIAERITQGFQNTKSNP